MGDRLVVAVTFDEFVNKGPGRPVFNEGKRMALLRELRCVDVVAGVRSSLEGLQIFMPDIFVKGSEYTDKILDEDRAFCEENGIEIRFTDEQTYSSTALLSHESRRR